MTVASVQDSEVRAAEISGAVQRVSSCRAYEEEGGEGDKVTGRRG
jgi:hypothetical protein